MRGINTGKKWKKFLSTSDMTVYLGLREAMIMNSNKNSAR